MPNKWKARVASSHLTLHSASVVVRQPDYGSYVTTIHWQVENRNTDEEWYSAWIAKPGLNNNQRIPGLDVVTPAEIGQMISEIIVGLIQIDREGTITSPVVLKGVSSADR